MSPAFAPSRASLPLRALRSARGPLVWLTACLAVAAAGHLAAQNPGDLDTSFTSGIVQLNLYTQVLETLPGLGQNRDLVVVGGDAGGFGILFQSVGTIDADINFPEFGALNRIIYTAVPEQVLQTGQTIPSILLGGQFGRGITDITNKLAARNIVRIKPTGELDTTFDPGRGANGFVTSILPLATGDIVCAGEFDTFNKQGRVRLARLTNKGALVDDSLFDANLSFDATVLSLAAQTVNGTTPASPQILVAGQFSNVSGKVHNKLARINPDGSVDDGFNPSFDNRTTIVVCQPDGKILVGGDFENVNGEQHKHIVRLNADGTVDDTFNISVTGQPFGFIDPPAVYVIKLLQDGRMYLGGNFTTVNGVTHNYLARVNKDGSLDEAFNAGTNIVNAVQSLSIQSDGKLLVGVNRSKANGDGKYPPVLFRLFAEEPTIKLTAKGFPAQEHSTNDPQTPRYGVFKLVRSGPIELNSTLTVYLQLGGNAKLPNPAGTTAKARNGEYILGNVDPYFVGAGQYTVTFQPGQKVAKINVIPTGETIGVDKKVTLRVFAGPSGTTGYNFSSAPATVILEN